MEEPEAVVVSPRDGIVDECEVSETGEISEGKEVGEGREVVGGQNEDGEVDNVGDKCVIRLRAQRRVRRRGESGKFESCVRALSVRSRESCG